MICVFLTLRVRQSGLSLATSLLLKGGDGREGYFILVIWGGVCGGGFAPGTSQIVAGSTDCNFCVVLANSVRPFLVMCGGVYAFAATISNAVGRRYVELIFVADIFFPSIVAVGIRG